MPRGYFHPRMSSRLGTCKLVEMDARQEVMSTARAELVEKIIEASSERVWIRRRYGMIEQRPNCRR
jgi:hypothetical protein